MNITIKRGHDIQIVGAPSKKILHISNPSKIAIMPVEFRGVKPKLLVEEGDSVKKGSP